MSEGSLWVFGGEQRELFREAQQWPGFRRALAVRVRADGSVERALEYVTPAEHRPEGAGSHCFQAATLVGDTAYLCTHTEILICSLPQMVIRRVISLPCFNDLHHVTLGPDGSLFVAVTGLDAVAELTPNGELRRLVSVLDGQPWGRFSPDVDYRRVASTKPHQAHPNHVFFLDGRPWVTRFEQRDAVPVGGGNGRLMVGNAGPHDGHVEDRLVTFTTVDGHVVTLDPASSRRVDVDLNCCSRDPRPLGWCRGVLPLPGDRAWVGFSRLRFTALRQNLSWVRHGFRANTQIPAPTRITLYDLAAPAVVREIELESVGLNAVFSIHAWSET